MSLPIVSWTQTPGTRLVVCLSRVRKHSEGPGVSWGVSVCGVVSPRSASRFRCQRSRSLDPHHTVQTGSPERERTEPGHPTGYEL
eukprot:3372661-Prymnesium_polylepis.1